MRNFLRSPIRATAFLGKEIYEVLRQPRLILTLALGPFLILLLFGIGFRNEPRAFRTVFVAPENSNLRQQVEEFATTLGPQLIYQGITPSQDQAIRSLRRGSADLVIVVPTDAATTIRNSEQAVFTLYHNEIDPLQASYVDYFGQIYVSEVNRRILTRITERGQSEAGAVQEELSTARANATAMREALARGDAASARLAQGELDTDLSNLEVALGATLAVLSGVEETIGAPEQAGEAAALQGQLGEIRAQSDALGQIQDNQGSYTNEAEQAAALEDRLINLETTLAEFRNIQPNVLVSPFRSQAESVGGRTIDITHFYAPGVLALLLQHLGVTFGALSIVRERSVTNTVELFHVSPISPGEILVGKYLSYIVFSTILAALLTLLLRYAVGMPMLGNWWDYVLVLALLLFSALGIGFFISLVSNTDSQAVQLSMLVLLSSVFFSGFFMALYLLWAPIRVISWMLPVTYAIQLLQNIMLRGQAPSLVLLGGLLVIGLVTFLLSWFMLARVMARR